MLSQYKVVLDANITIYSRDTCGILTHYYQAVQITVPVSARYSFEGLGDAGLALDGVLYKDTFDSFNPSRNPIAESYRECDDDDFALSHYLQTNTTYVLVLTTASSNFMGVFWMQSHGIASVNFTRLGQYQSPSGDPALWMDCLNSFVLLSSATISL